MSDLAKLSVLTVLTCLVFFALPVHATNPNQGQPLGWPGTTLAGNPCYGQLSAFGPFDYTLKANWTKDRLFVVEKVHFPPETANLTGTGAKVKSKDLERALGADMNYTLRAFPNHHRALWSWVRLYLQNRNQRSDHERQTMERLKQGNAPPECWLQRAIQFAPKDPKPRMIFGIYLHKKDRFDQALEHYLAAEKLQPNDSELKYNLGLLYFDTGDYDKAREYADQAKQLGYPLSGLDRKLRKTAKGP